MPEAMKALRHVVSSPRNRLHSMVRIWVGDTRLEGELEIPEAAQGVVLLSHGSGSSHHSPRNPFVARILGDAGIGTLLLDLLTADEEQEDSVTCAYRFDIALLASRLLGATYWLEQQTQTRALPLGYFGASTGGGAALVAAAARGDRLAAVVSRGGRPELAGEALTQVKCPTLLLVGGLDDVVLHWNAQALAKLNCEKELRIIPGASHRFEEPGKLEQVAWISAAWFSSHMTGSANFRQAP